MTIFTDEQEELRSSARRFLEDKSSSATVRELMETEAGFGSRLEADGRSRLDGNRHPRGLRR